MATIEWSEIVNLLVRKQSQHKLFLQDDVQQLDILARICREDNYIIALYNRLDEFFPSSLSLPFGLRVHTFNGVMLRALRIKLLGPGCLITSNKHLSESFVHNFQELQHSFRSLGLLFFALSPFMACYVIIKAFVGNADTLRRDPAALTSRGWSVRARWQFREYNEMPHELERRLLKAVAPAQSYVNRFKKPWIVVVAQLCVVVLGSSLAFLLFVGFLNEEFLSARVLGRNLVWFITVCGFLLAIAKSFSSDDVCDKSVATLMDEIVSFTHYFPKRGGLQAKDLEAQEVRVVMVLCDFHV